MANDRIRVLFSISDINSAAADDFLHEDDMVGEEGEEDAASFPVRASVTIEKVILFP
jgi:complement component 1 Q subcomponent-binding protein